MSKKIRTITRPLYSVRGFMTARKTPPGGTHPVAALLRNPRTRCKYLERCASHGEAPTAVFDLLCADAFSLRWMKTFRRRENSAERRAGPG